MRIRQSPSQMMSVASYMQLLSLVLAWLFPSTVLAVDGFPGTPENYHGVQLHSFPIGEDTVKVLAPENALDGEPWILAPSLYSLENPAVAFVTHTQIALVKRGFHVVTIPLGNTFGAPEALIKFDRAYQEMTNTYGLAKKATLLGVSREGLAITRWAAANPGKVASLYMDKAVCDIKSWPGGKLGMGKGSPANWESLKKLYGFASDQEAMEYSGNPIDLANKLVSDKIPMLYLAGELDDAVPFSENGERMEKEYKRFGGRFELIMHHGEGHHPHGSPDPQPVIDFIERCSRNVDR